jgi:hypothetical protein
MNKPDRLVKLLASASVLAVAAFAAIISYQHIFDLSRRHGQSSLAASLMPLSVDLLIAAASLIALYAVRHALRVPALARVMLGLGIAATIGANGAYGIAYGWPGVVISAWPAIAFIGSAELVLWLVRASAEHAAQPRNVRRSAVSGDGTDKTVIRQWARDSGYDISDRGRIPAEIEAAYLLRDSNGQYSMQAN